LDTLLPLRPNGAVFSGRPSNTLNALGPGDTLDALSPGKARNTLRSGQALDALRTGQTLLAAVALRPNGAGQPLLSTVALRPRCSGQALLSAVALRASRTLSTLSANRPFAAILRCASQNEERYRQNHDCSHASSGATIGSTAVGERQP
jgi:hypothetical protein